MYNSLFTNFKKQELMKQTAVSWFYDKIKSHFENDGELLETLTFTMEIAKKKEREQHGNTWDAAIKAHDDRGHVHARSLTDFDDYLVWGAFCNYTNHYKEISEIGECRVCGLRETD